jgi:hypothetical protein
LSRSEEIPSSPTRKRSRIQEREEYPGRTKGKQRFYSQRGGFTFRKTLVLKNNDRVGPFFGGGWVHFSLAVAPQATISAIENGHVNLGVERAKVLARALNCHPAVLVFPGREVPLEHAA